MNVNGDVKEVNSDVEMMEINVYHIGLKILGRIYYTDFNEVIIKINVLPADDRIWEVVYIEA